MRISIPTLLIALLLGSFVGCGDDDVSDGDASIAVDATVDATGFDAVVPDVSLDMSVADSSLDGTPDATLDATPDATPDAIPDAIVDATVDTAPDAMDASGLCHDVAYAGPEVSLQMVAALPTLAGGTILPGTYVATQFLTTGGLTGALRSTLLIDATSIRQLQQITLAAPGAMTPRIFDWQTNGTQLTRTESCPGTEVLTTNFSATATSLTIGFSSSVHVVYQRQ